MKYSLFLPSVLATYEWQDAGYKDRDGNKVSTMYAVPEYTDSYDMYTNGYLLLSTTLEDGKA